MITLKPRTLQDAVHALKLLEIKLPHQKELLCAIIEELDTVSQRYNLESLIKEMHEFYKEGSAKQLDIKVKKKAMGVFKVGKLLSAFFDDPFVKKSIITFHLIAMQNVYKAYNYFEIEYML